MTTQKSNWFIAACIVGILSAGAANATVAQDSGHRMVIKFDPNILSTDQGVRELYHSIKLAAEDVCPLPTGTMLVSGAVQACRNEAVAQAIHSINNPRLAAAAAARPSKG